MNNPHVFVARFGPRCGAVPPTRFVERRPPRRGCMTRASPQSEGDSGCEVGNVPAGWGRMGLGGSARLLAPIYYHPSAQPLPQDRAIFIAMNRLLCDGLRGPSMPPWPGRLPSVADRAQGLRRDDLKIGDFDSGHG